MAQAARRLALDRACTKFGWIMLNGRCVSDGFGMPTCVHGAVSSVVDYAVVPRKAQGNLRVLPVHGRDGNHQALFVSLAIQRPVSPLDPAPVAGTSWTAVVWLTVAE